MSLYRLPTFPEWHILAPRVQKAHRVLIGSRCFRPGLEEILFNDRNPWDAWSKLARPGALLRKSTSLSVVGGARGNVLSRLESLPAELIALILVDPSLERS